ncbi:hypothetical protein ACFL57_05230 [Candidatus Margulisiibacteriota bacterium]
MQMKIILQEAIRDENESANILLNGDIGNHYGHLRFFIFNRTEDQSEHIAKAKKTLMNNRRDRFNENFKRYEKRDIYWNYLSPDIQKRIEICDRLSELCDELFQKDLPYPQLRREGLKILFTFNDLVDTEPEDMKIFLEQINSTKNVGESLLEYLERNDAGITIEELKKYSEEFETG